MKIKTLRLIPILITVILSINTSAIVMRHDVAAEEYLLDTLDYQSTILIDGCTATLIAPRWILTAAHCIGQGYQPGTQVNIGDEVLEVMQNHIHPAFDKEIKHIHDIALIELFDPSFSKLPTPIYEKNDEQGKVLKLVGFGNTGNGKVGVNNNCFPCDLRGADNFIDLASDYHLRFRFDDPKDNNSLPLEGVGGGGDSGGPLFITMNSERFVAGVSSLGKNLYGEFDNYTRVSKELDWLKEIMKEEYIGSYSGPLYSEVAHLDSYPDYLRNDNNSTDNNDDDINENNQGGAMDWVFLCLVFSRLFRQEVVLPLETKVDGK